MRRQGMRIALLVVVLALVVGESARAITPGQGSDLQPLVVDWRIAPGPWR